MQCALLMTKGMYIIILVIINNINNDIVIYFTIIHARRTYLLVLGLLID